MFDDVSFKMTYARSRPSTLVPWIEKHNVPLLTNAIHRWSDATDRFLDMWEYDTPHVIDAGGYNVMADYVTKHGNLSASVTGGDIHTTLRESEPFYPWELEEYHQWLCEHSDEFQWATVMDYACEERFDVLWDYESRIDATFENTVAHFNRLDDDDHPYTVLPVLQGRSVDEYVEFYERCEDHGIPTDAVGLGTVCRLSSEKEIAHVESSVRERTGVDWMHGFGVKVDAFKYNANFESADSQAWVYSPSNGRCVIHEDGSLRDIPMPDNSRERTVESFKNYYSYVTKLQCGESAIGYESPARNQSDEMAVETIVQHT
jgi:hypothetical protein